MKVLRMKAVTDLHSPHVDGDTGDREGTFTPVGIFNADYRGKSQAQTSFQYDNTH